MRLRGRTGGLSGVTRREVGVRCAPECVGLARRRTSGDFLAAGPRKSPIDAGARADWRFLGCQPAEVANLLEELDAEFDECDE